MKINIHKTEISEMPPNEFNINIEYSVGNKNIESFVNYINSYNEKFLVIDDYNNTKEIFLKDIICFYSEGRNNYCKTTSGNYHVRKKLYEIEKQNYDFIRISKSCIVNIEHIDRFDLGITGTIKIVLDDGSVQVASRRRARDVADFLDQKLI